MAMIPYWPAQRCSSSTLTLAIVSLPSYSPASSSRIGATARHGPHQGAQKSTTTGTSDCSTFCSNSLSVTVIGLAMRRTSLRSIIIDQKYQRRIPTGGMLLLLYACFLKRQAVERIPMGGIVLVLYASFLERQRQYAGLCYPVFRTITSATHT